MLWRKAYGQNPPHLEGFLAEGGSPSSLFFAQTVSLDLGYKEAGVFWLLYLMAERGQRGHIAHPIKALARDWESLWDDLAPPFSELQKAQDWSERFPQPQPNSPAPLWFLPESRVFYFEKDLSFEQDFIQAVSRRLLGEHREVAVDWPRYWSQVKISTLDSSQKVAVEKSLGKALYLLSGGPGTGKTTALKAILQCALDLEGLKPEEIALLAPTGRAAQRMAESLRGFLTEKDKSREGQTSGAIAPKTIQRLLGLRSFRNAAVHYHRQAQLPQKLVIVDEASMLDLRLFGLLLNALGEESRLILVGDKDQLPSVDSGAVLGDLLGVLGQWAKGQKHFAVLEKVYRSQGGVLLAAKALANHSTDELSRTPEGQLEMFSPNTPTLETWSSLADKGFVYHKELPEEGPRSILRPLWSDLGFAALEDLARSYPQKSIAPQALGQALEEGILLSSTRKGLWGTQYLNRILSEYLTKDLSWRGHLPGTPVLVTANDPSLGINNGDRGLLVLEPRNGLEGADRGFSPKVLFVMDGGVRAIPLGLIQAWQPGWAMTIHKAQGSEYAKVAVLLPPNQAGHLNREILYTGITRAKEHCWLWSDEQTVLQALENQTKRDSGIVQGILQSLGEI
jgi:exodeoxyribonuclease V alpha subunit